MKSACETGRNFSRVWLRVPIYAGDADALSFQNEVTVQSVDGKGPIRKATRVLAPPTADPLAVTADLYFELPNKYSLCLI